jgi:hypothetical protein
MIYSAIISTTRSGLRFFSIIGGGYMNAWNWFHKFIFHFIALSGGSINPARMPALAGLLCGHWAASVFVDG